MNEDFNIEERVSQLDGQFRPDMDHEDRYLILKYLDKLLEGAEERARYDIDYFNHTFQGDLHRIQNLAMKLVNVFINKEEKENHD